MIYIIGYMGVGKSTIGKILSKEINIPFIDTDDYIENITGKTINEIFNKHGEIYFRKLEKKIISEIKGNNIVACGGGLPINNIEYINKNGTSIYLQASNKFLYNRLKGIKKNRPLIKYKNNEELRDYIQKQMFLREHVYKKAKHIINIENKNKLDILREINTLITLI